MENEVEGCASPTAARRENSMPATRGGNRMPEIPDAADEIEILRAAKRNWRRVLCGGRGRRARAVQRGRRGGERRHQATVVEQGAVHPAVEDARSRGVARRHDRPGGRKQR